MKHSSQSVRLTLTTVAVGIASLWAGIVFGMLLLLEIPAIGAATVSSLVLVFVYRYARSRTEAESKVSDFASWSKWIVSFEGYHLSWVNMLIYGALIFFAVESSAGIIVAFLIGPLNQGPMEVSVATFGILGILPTMLSPVLNLILAFRIGIEIGARCDKDRIWVAIASVGTGIGTIGVLFIISYLFAYAGHKYDMFAQFGQRIGLHAAILLVIILPLLAAAIGYWRGKRGRYSRYFEYILRRLPANSRDALTDFVLEKSKRYTPERESLLIAIGKQTRRRPRRRNDTRPRLKRLASYIKKHYRELKVLIVVLAIVVPTSVLVFLLCEHFGTPTDFSFGLSLLIFGVLAIEVYDSEVEQTGKRRRKTAASSRERGLYTYPRYVLVIQGLTVISATALSSMLFLLLLTTGSGAIGTIPARNQAIILVGFIVLTFPLAQLVFAGFIGHWIGNRAERQSTILAVIVVLLGSLPVIAAIFFSDPTAELLRGGFNNSRLASQANVTFSLLWLVGIIVWAIPSIVISMIVSIITCRSGQRARISRLLGFIVSALPPERRNTVWEMVNQEAQCLTKIDNRPLC